MFDSRRECFAFLTACMLMLVVIVGGCRMATSAPIPPAKTDSRIAGHWINDKDQIVIYLTREHHYRSRWYGTEYVGTWSGDSTYFVIREWRPEAPETVVTYGARIENRQLRVMGHVLSRKIRHRTKPHWLISD